MTKCCTPAKKTSQKSNTSFFYKILSSLKQLQISSPYRNGATIDDIAKFMECKYDLSGDIPSQIENSLCIAEESRFVIRKKNLYSLVSPAATLQLIPAPCMKAKLERIQKVFNTKWCETDSTEGQEKNNCVPRRSRSARVRRTYCREERREARRGCRSKKRVQLPKPKCKSKSRSRSRQDYCQFFKPKRSRRRRREKCTNRSFSTSSCGTRSRTRMRKAKRVPMCTRSSSSYGSASYCKQDGMDTESTEC